MKLRHITAFIPGFNPRDDPRLKKTMRKEKRWLERMASSPFISYSVSYDLLDILGWGLLHQETNLTIVITLLFAFALTSLILSFCLARLLITKCLQISYVVVGSAGRNPPPTRGRYQCSSCLVTSVYAHATAVSHA